jgi:HK97 gp10 family phage protein
VSEAFTVTVHGLREFESELRILREAFKARTGGIINRALMAGAIVIRNEARSLAPVLQDPQGKGYRAFKARARHQAGRALSVAANHRVPGNIKHNIIAHYVREKPLTVWVRVRTKTYIFAPRKSSRVPGRWGARGGADPSNLVGNPNYWWLVEFGTSRMTKRPFMRPAFDNKRGEALNAFRASMRRQIDEHFAKRLRIAA